MSIDQRKFIGELTLWILRTAIAIAAFFSISMFNDVRDDIREIKTEVVNARHELNTVRERVIRLETKIEK